MRVLLPLLAALLAWAPAQAQGLLHELASPNEEPFGHFGASVAGLPDLDGDSTGDLLVGVPFETVGADDAGRAYVFSGATGAPLRTLASPIPENDGYFGGHVAGVPDADGDGVADLLIGATGEDGGADDAGRAYLFSGATGALLRILFSPNPEDDGHFGSTVAGVADLDGDGRGDLLVGGSESPGGLLNAGRACVFSGATGALLHTLVSPNPEEAGFFGVGAGVGDVDGDGAGDVVVGAPWEDPGSSPGEAGRAYVFSGATGALLFELVSPNEEEGGTFGAAVSGVDDVDGDGVGDVAVGAAGEGPGPSPIAAGRVYLFSGATGALLLELASPNEEFGGTFGRAVAGVPDADGDGKGDLIVGARAENPGSSPQSAGRAYVFSGDPKGTAVEGGEPLSALTLYAPRPNPSGGRLVLAFAVPEAGAVRVAVYDLLGREVAVLVDRPLAADRHELAFDGSGLPAGVYVVRAAAGEAVAVRRVTLVR